MTHSLSPPHAVKPDPDGYTKTKHPDGLEVTEWGSGKTQTTF
eukprot:COSAG06_NODE_49517_length_325_cov_0.455752_1_plen_41_part_10